MKDITKHPEYFDINFRFPNEIFKQVSDKVPNFKNYEVSNYGRIISSANKKIIILRQSNAYLGYKIVKLGWENLLSIARITAITFISNPENKPEINHINGIKYDNRIENIEWVTHQENMIHAVKTGLRRYDNCKQRSKGFTQKEINEIFDYRRYNIPIKLLAEHYGRSPTTVSQLLRGLTYKTRANLAKKTCT